VVQEGQSDGSESSPVGIMCRLPVEKQIIGFFSRQDETDFPFLNSRQTRCGTQIASCPKDIEAEPREVKLSES
jgi:hypothetical protein